jgi:muramoyltetrapeptide carboxypeptidase
LVLLLQDLEAFGKTLEQIVLKKVSEYSYPICFHFPVGHQKNNFALKCGVVLLFFVNQEKVLLEEII